ncbi:MAG: NRDE family protein [Alcaligenaceae bacterium]|nr:NRDE family protein [Alcaligenaceae bacterium]
MCIAYFRFQPEQEAALFIAANRDEFHGRPTALATTWQDPETIIAGQDLEAGGTWLGANRQGGAAFITNIRDPLTINNSAKSRGTLVLNALTHQAKLPHHWFEETPLKSFLAAQGPLEDYNGFNLVFGDAKKLYYLNNYAVIKQAHLSQNKIADSTKITDHKPHELTPGSYTLSNADLYTVWPKTKELSKSLDTVSLSTLNSKDFAQLDSNNVRHFTDEIFSRLADTEKAPEHLLPKTGVSDGFEKLLSSPFIISPEYGTRCSSIILSFKDGNSFMAERSFDAQGNPTHQIFFYQNNGTVIGSS